MTRPAPGDLTTRGGRTCPVCGHGGLQPSIDLGSHSLFACPGCGCWSSDAAHRGAATSFQPEAYFRHDDADRPRWRHLLELLASSGALPERALDVGCGTGAFLEFLAEARPGCELAGIELDPARAERARSRLPGARILTADAQEGLGSLSGPFDLITLWDVFEHLPAPAEVLRELARLLAPGGRLYIQTIHEDSILPRLGRLVYRLSGGRLSYPARRTHEAHHLVFFSLRGLESLAADCDLVIERRWFDRLRWRRMDGPAPVTLAASALLAVENRLGNGLFVNLLLAPSLIRT